MAPASPLAPPMGIWLLCRGGIGQAAGVRGRTSGRQSAAVADGQASGGWWWLDYGGGVWRGSGSTCACVSFWIFVGHLKVGGEW
jgi:hypothetical protein